jgi:Arc/MetJ-type ribon-helix-helix transcriptional regulator
VPTSIRLDPSSEQIVRQVAHRTRRTKSEVIRDAIRRLAEDTPTPTGGTVADLVADLVGTVRGGDRHYASRSEAVLRRMLALRRRTR